MSLLDIALWAGGKNKYIKFLAHDLDFNGEQGQIQSAHSLFQSYLPDVDVEEHPGSDDLSNVWFVIACGADYVQRPLLELNHWVSAWHKDQIKGNFEELCQKTRQKFAERRSACKKAIDAFTESQAEVEDGDDQKPDMLSNYLSLSEEIDRKEQAFEAFLECGLFAPDVPADGDCGVWTLHSLRTNAYESLANRKAPGSISDVRKIRKEACLRLSPSAY